MQVFEDRSSYTPGVDAVAKIVLSVECHPGQELSIIQWLGGVSKLAGVYCVDLSAPVVEIPITVAEIDAPFPAPEPVALPDVVETHALTEAPAEVPAATEATQTGEAPLVPLGEPIAKPLL